MTRQASWSSFGLTLSTWVSASQPGHSGAVAVGVCSQKGGLCSREGSSSLMNLWMSKLDQVSCAMNVLVSLSWPCAEPRMTCSAGDVNTVEWDVSYHTLLPK